MQNIIIAQYREIFDRYLEEDLTNDDLKLGRKVDYFFKLKKMDKITEIVAFLRDKSISPNSLALADELEIMMTDEPIAEPTPVSNSSATIAPPDIISAPAEISAYPPVQVAVKAVAEASPVPKIDNAKEFQQQELSTASVPLPVSDNVFFIDPNDEVKIHEFAASFPQIEGDEYEQFIASIKLGQQSPVIILKGELLDGRNRLKACRELGIKTMAVEYSGEKTAVQVITDLNIYRRHLTASQRAAYGLRLLPVLEHEAKERKKAGVADHSENIRSGRAVDLAGAQVGVNGRYIEDARTVANSSPELLQRLISGEITIPEAKKQIRPAKATPVQPAKILFSVGEAVARLLELIPEKDNPSLVEIGEHSPTAIRKAIEARLNPDTAEAPEPGESNNASAEDAPVFDF